MPIRRFSTFAACLMVVSTGFVSAADDLPSEERIRSAVAKSLPLLAAGATGGMKNQKQCFTCHSQALPVIAMKAASERGFPLDEDLVKTQLQFSFDFLVKNRERFLEGKGSGGQVDTAGYGLWMLADAGWKSDELTTAMTTYLLRYQSDKDHWESTSKRPPTQQSPFTASYLALRGLRTFGTDDQHEAITKRRTQVLEWLKQAKPRDNEDRVFRLWALSEAEAGQVDIESAGKALLQTQKDDGGWAQDGERASDAYATATALVALYETGRSKTGDPAWQKGLSWLLDHQETDGSWHVVTHAKPIQVYFESGYPHGVDQFISIAAASWATTALADALPVKTPGGTP